MSTFTEHYHLIKPGEGDFYDVQDFNENFDAIDTQLAQSKAGLDGLGDTLAGLTQGGGMQGVVKSIQRVKFSPKSSTTQGTCPLLTRVQAEKCLVILERLKDGTNSGCAFIDYTLGEEEISVSHLSYSGTPNIMVGFWIVEFY